MGEERLAASELEPGLGSILYSVGAKSKERFTKEGSRHGKPNKGQKLVECDAKPVALRVANFRSWFWWRIVE